MTSSQWNRWSKWIIYVGAVVCAAAIVSLFLPGMSDSWPAVVLREAPFWFLLASYAALAMAFTKLRQEDTEAFTRLLKDAGELKSRHSKWAREAEEDFVEMANRIGALEAVNTELRRQLETGDRQC